MTDFWSMMTEFINSSPIKYLVGSPFQNYVMNWDGIDYIKEYLPYVNWFLPVSICMDIMLIWLAAIAVFYGSQAILRYMRIID